MTSCPPKIAEILLEILATGLLSIRALGWSGKANRCGLEADHIQNLPLLLADYDPERLLYYWDVERVCYRARMPRANIPTRELLWRQLEPHVDLTRESIDRP